MTLYPFSFLCLSTRQLIASVLGAKYQGLRESVINAMVRFTEHREGVIDVIGLV
jgi:hypothetical protein